ncbi:hypothetical protein CONPUDRAFT_134720 [Coniophora puteana RWD-64-598 SS2]|uniref:Mitochondrial import inner membrane translocase subunit TIM54 n=1 Tax=Coniophora puteana (strain RWD-64-598) TaxID=741705 RepID=A0A5M3N1U9_CONPW|nr:uncharacterized protein CONPUDRAFT_134720 [Coniophora puteana RWD-64-598 SS2]EIW84851.1 hypothetical protein CONPUDRAFT_134720 [Coniophora puteana RWD-64-598 SS2]
MSSRGIKAALQYTGIPASWLNKRPKLPSRNWLIFLSVTSSVTSYYIYDRRQCTRIRDEFKERVRHLAEEPLGTQDLPRKVQVYASKWPGDQDPDTAGRFFKKYVKPILVAAAVDYTLHVGRKHGDTERLIYDQTVDRRRIDAGLDPEPAPPVPLPHFPSYATQRARELEGGTILVGRHTLKEYLAGLSRGWSAGLARVDREEALAQELASDGAFDLPPDPEDPAATLDGEPIPTQSRLTPSMSLGLQPDFRTMQQQQKSAAPQSADAASSSVAVPSEIPPQPPMLFVPFTDHIGFRQVPCMIWGFFNERHKVRAGAEAAYKLIMNHTRPIIPPSPSSTTPASEFAAEETKDASAAPSSSSPTSTGSPDLDFDTPAESFYEGSFHPSEVEKSREKYYKDLPEKLSLARDPSKASTGQQVKTEVELRQERLTKETRWRNDVAAWEVLKPGQPATWDPRFEGVLKVFDNPPKDEKQPSSSSLS